jgi:hypothetical protein
MKLGDRFLVNYEKSMVWEFGKEKTLPKAVTPKPNTG